MSEVMTSLRRRVGERETPRLARDYEQAETDAERVNVGHRHHDRDHIAGLSQSSVALREDLDAGAVTPVAPLRAFSLAGWHSDPPSEDIRFHHDSALSDLG